MALIENSLFASLLNGYIIQSGIQAKEIAARVGISDRTLSMIRHGSRRASQELAEKLARALAPEANAEKVVGEFRLAALSAPQGTEGKVRHIVTELRTIEGLLDVEDTMQSGQQVWVFCRTLLETYEPKFYRVVLKNLGKGVHYTYFLHPDNAVDSIKLADHLKNDGCLMEHFCNAIIAPKEAFHLKDPNFFQAVYDAEKPDCFSYKTVRDSEGDYCYLGVHPDEAADFRDHLSALKRQADENNDCEQSAAAAGPKLPISADRYLRRSLTKYFAGESQYSAT
jgi:transcriptional regulator with XRE-family HTH domain